MTKNQLPAEFSRRSARFDIPNEYGWSSLYMGQPVPRGGALFDVATTIAHDQLPQMTHHSMGIDLAYTARSKSDYCAAVVLGWSREGVAYVVDVVKEHLDVQRFGAKIAKLADRYGCIPAWHCTRQEEDLATLLFKEHGIRIDVKSVSADKFTRAQPASVAWNSSKILTIRDRAWSQGFLHEIERFNGSPAQNDDQLDALVSAYEGGRRANVRAPEVSGERVFSSAPPDAVAELQSSKGAFAETRHTIRASDEPTHEDQAHAPSKPKRSFFWPLLMVLVISVACYALYLLLGR